MSENLGKRYRTHPILILYYSRWVLFVGILPLIRSLTSFLKGEFMQWSFGSWVDFAIIAAIVILGVFNWCSFTYSTNDMGINIRRGVIIHRDVTLDWDKVTVMKKKRPLYLRLVGAAFLQIDTLGGNLKDVDVSLCVTTKKSEILLDSYNLYIQANDNIEHTKPFKPSISSIFYLAFVSTNNFVGFFYIVTLISQSGRILGEFVPEMIIGSIENFIKAIEIPVSPAGFLISYFLLIAWAIGVVFTLLRYYKYNAWCNGDSLLSAGGILTKQAQVINMQNISYINIRQNIASYFLDRFSLYVHTAGAGKERSDLSCVIPNSKQHDFFSSIDYLFSGYSIGDITVRPIAGSSMRFLFLPSAISIGITLLIVILTSLIPKWKDFLWFICIMALIPMVMLAVVSFIEKRYSGIGKSGQFYRISYTRYFVLNTMVIDESKIVQIKMRQSIAQRIHGSANLYIYTLSEGKKTHRCRNVRVSEVNELMGDYIYDIKKRT